MRILSALIQSYVWIGLGAASTYFYSCQLINNLDFNPAYALLIFSSTCCLYTILGNLKRQVKLSSALMISITTLLVLIALIKLSDFQTFILLIPSVLIGFLYGYKGGLRRVPYLKVFLIALIWVYTTIFIPLMQSDLLFEISQVYFIISMILFLLGITIPFDVRDVYFDSPSIRTLPQVMGIKKSIVFSVFCVVMSAFFSVIFMNETGTLSNNYLALTWFPITILAVAFSKDTRPSFYFTGLLDGLLLLQGFLAYFFVSF